jgi:hypothetical protein
MQMVSKKSCKDIIYYGLCIHGEIEIMIRIRISILDFGNGSHTFRCKVPGSTIYLSLSSAGDISVPLFYSSMANGDISAHVRF